MALFSGLKRVKNVTLDLLFPPHCVGCGKEGSLLCVSCGQKLSYIPAPVCCKCGRPVSAGSYCASCVRHPLKLNGIRSPLRFEGVVRQAILEFKYRNLRALALPLAQILSKYLCASPLPADALVSVPLHPRRLRERGYNQSALMALELAKLTGLPLIEESLIRLKDTGTQVMASSINARWSNVAGAFVCRDESFLGKQIILIDDVCTTGATLDSCGAALKAAGASSVWGLTVAREV